MGRPLVHVISPATRLAELETIIETDIAAFVRVGRALAEIREARLYKESHSSFEVYCQERWRLSGRHANRLIQGATVAQEMGPRGPTSEKQARALLRLPDPADRAEAWAEAVESAPDGEVTAAHVDDVVRRRRADLTALTSSASVEWYTPEDVVELARHVMGGIDLDPASCEEANEVVRAETFFSVVQDGYGRPWPGRVLLNSPYGRNEEWESNQARWSRHLIEQYRAGITKQAFLVVSAATSNAWFESLWDFGLCFPRRRLKFRQPRGTKPCDQPTQSHALVYLPPAKRRVAALAKFTGAFGRLGRCVLPRGSVSEAA